MAGGEFGDWLENISEKAGDALEASARLFEGAYGDSRQEKDTAKSADKQRPAETVFGAGGDTNLEWTFINSDSVVRDSDGKLVSFQLVTRKGQTSTFTYDAGKGLWTEKDDASGKVAELTGVSFKASRTDPANVTRYDPDKTKVCFQPEGMTEQYDDTGRLVSTVESDGAVTFNSYNTDGTTETLYIDAQGYRSSTKYDKEYNELESKTKEAGSPVIKVMRGGEATPFRYEIKQPGGHIEAIDIKDDGSVALTRGEEKLTFPKKSAVSVDNDGTRKIVDAKGVIRYEGHNDGTTIMRDANGQVIETTNPNGTVSKYTRDKKGEITSYEVRNSEKEIIDMGWKDGELTYSSSAAREQDGFAVVSEIRTDDNDGTLIMDLHDGKTIERSADGVEELFDAKGEYVASPADKLLDKIELDLGVSMTEAERRQFQADMAEIGCLSAAQQESIYKSFETILTAATDSTTKLKPEQRKELVVDLANQIADPEAIRQGGKNTCMVASLERMMAGGKPDKYAEMVATLATTGKFRAPDGTEVSVQRESTARGAAIGGKTDALGLRSFASELFQNATVKLALPSNENYQSYLPGQSDFNPLLGVDPSQDTGERKFVTYDPYKPAYIQEFHGLTDSEIARALKQLMPDVAFEQKTIATEADFVAAATGGLPMIVGFHTNVAAFDGMGAGASFMGSDGHAVAVTNVEKHADGKYYVYYDNAAGGSDHSYGAGTGVPLAEFVAAMQAPKGSSGSRGTAVVRKPKS